MARIRNNRPSLVVFPPVKNKGQGPIFLKPGLNLVDDRQMENLADNKSVENLFTVVDKRLGKTILTLEDGPDAFTEEDLPEDLGGFKSVEAQTLIKDCNDVDRLLKWKQAGDMRQTVTSALDKRLVALGHHGASGSMDGEED
jgi:hypothetical protein